MIQLITVGRVVSDERTGGLCRVNERRVLARMKQESNRFHSSSLAQLAH